MHMETITELGRIETEESGNTYMTVTWGAAAMVCGVILLIFSPSYLS